MGDFSAQQIFQKLREKTYLFKKIPEFKEALLKNNTGMSIPHLVIR